MEAARGGDMGAFAEIVRRHQSAVWRTAYRFTGDRSEAEDLAQETFLRVLGSSARYRPTASFRTYLYCILNRLCLDHVRKMRPAAADQLPEAAAHAPSPDEAASRREREAAVQAAVNALPPNQRMAIVLRYFEELGWSEISEAMGVSPKAVERLLSRGREALADRLSAFLED
jgi:RNA polymerase sigma-70 factor (ECF subfamily)